jgi:hypothetical protein
LNVSKLPTIRFLGSFLLFLALFSSLGLFPHGAVSFNLPVQRDILALTVNPDRSVGVSWTTTSSLGSLAQNISRYFTPGYAIHSSSNFSQQSNAVVQTSTVRYQLPPQGANFFNTISLTATRTGLTSQGTFSIATNFPTSSITGTFSTSFTQVRLNATALFYFSQIFLGRTFLANQTIFQKMWNKTFANNTWTDHVVGQIQNATIRAVQVTTFNGTINSISSRSVNVSLGFVAVPSQPATDFVIAFESLLSNTGVPLPAGVDSIIRSALILETGETLSLTYTGGSTPTIVINSTTNYVSDLDAQLNKVKNQYFQLIFALVPVGTVIPAPFLFLNSTSVTVSQISTTSDLDLATGRSSMSLKGLILKPPTAGSNPNFTIPGLFQTLGKAQPPGVNFTLVGGSDSSNMVKIVVPAATTQPGSTTANSATWTNLQDFSTLSAVEFQVQPLPNSFFAFLMSPVGIAIEAIVAIAIIAIVVLCMAKRRAAKTSLPTAPGPTPSPGLGLSPAPPTP